MITIVSGTARAGSRTRKVADNYERIFLEKGISTHMLSLEEYAVWQRNENFETMEAKLIVPAEKFVFIVPEYNGSIPGMLKMLFDNSAIQQCWYGKKALITGLADGRAGNLRGLDHLTGILNFLHVNVYWNKIPLSRISTEMDENGLLLQPATRAAIEEQIIGFLAF